MSTTNPLVSILTPVYNGERHLAECIASVRAQTFTDWEYLIVDNCSTDATADIAGRYAAADPRIRVIRSTEFLCVQDNFNRGIRLMNPASRYCKFVSADDWIYPEYLERTVAVAERHPDVGVVNSYSLVNDRVQGDRVVPYTDETLAGPEVIRAALRPYGRYILGSPTQLLFRADLVRATDPFFDKKTWHSDAHAAFRTLLHSDLGFVHQVLSFSREHSGSLSARTESMNTVLANMTRFLVEFGPRIFPAAEYRTNLRGQLRIYARFLLKQRLRSGRHRDPRFWSFHRQEIDRMLGELGDEPWARRILRALRLSLAKPAGQEGKWTSL